MEIIALDIKLSTHKFNFILHNVFGKFLETSVNSPIYNVFKLKNKRLKKIYIINYCKSYKISSVADA